MQQEEQVRSSATELVKKHNALLKKYDVKDATILCCKNGNFQLFKDIVQEFPRAPVRFVLKNFNKPESMCAVEVLVAGLGVADKACIHHVNAIALFPEIEDWVSLAIQKEMIHIKIILEEAQEIANILRRELHITHCFGTDSDSEQSKNEYGPFIPC